MKRLWAVLVLGMVPAGTGPRFNNAASQTTLLVIQNATPEFGVPVNGHYWLMDSTGQPLNSINNSFTLPPGGMFVRNTSFDAFQGSGSIVITNDAGYGAVTGKAVAVEPATGFSFDTALACRPH